MFRHVARHRYGRLTLLQQNVAAALAANASAPAGSPSLLVGLGAAPEAIETDPIMYDLLFELAWTPSPSPPSSSSSYSSRSPPPPSSSTTTEAGGHGLVGDGGGAAVIPAAAAAAAADDDPAAADADAFDVASWVRAWATRRYSTYGVAVPEFAVDAWETMVSAGPYGCQRPQQGPVGSLVAARPNMDIPRVSCCDETDLYYDPAVLVQVWASMIGNATSGGSADPAVAALRAKSTFLHDVADVGTQVLSNLALALHAEAVAAYGAKNGTWLAEVGALFLQAVRDVDALAATQDQRLLGQWIAAARATASSNTTTALSSSSSSSTTTAAAAASFPPSKCDRQTIDPTKRLNCGFPGIGQGDCEAQGCCYDADFGDFPACFFGDLASEADEMERNARTLVTLWGPEQSGLHEYAYRLWGGLVGAFYLPRWTRWFDAVGAALAKGTAFDQSAFDLAVEEFEQAWCNNASDTPQDTFPTQPTDPSQVLPQAEAILARVVSASER